MPAHARIRQPQNNRMELFLNVHSRAAFVRKISQCAVVKFTNGPQKSGYPCRLRQNVN